MARNNTLRLDGCLFLEANSNCVVPICALSQGRDLMSQHPLGLSTHRAIPAHLVMEVAFPPVMSSSAN